MFNVDSLDKLKKDLEILEILKRNLTILYNGVVIDFFDEMDKNINTKPDKTDFERIKEWLTENV